MAKDKDMIKKINEDLQLKLFGIAFEVENINGMDMLISKEKRTGRKKLITFWDVIRFGGEFQLDILPDWIFLKFCESEYM